MSGATPAPSGLTTGEQDLAAEAFVVQRVLDAHPVRITISELARELNGETVDFGTHDLVERAADSLARIGLLHLHDNYLSPTRAAIRCAELLDR